jgi:gamma-glutamyltranspeptidase/glutathione hydrolase
MIRLVRSIGSLPLFWCLSAAAVPFKGQQFVVSAPTPYAVEAAKHIYQKGGNVADAAVAMALTLSVTSPYFASLGGGGLAVIHIGDQTTALNFREMAPKSMTETTFKGLAKDASRTGGLAVAIPGIPAGLVELHKKFGKLKWSQLFDDALMLAKSGFRVSGDWSENTVKNKDRFSPSAQRFFFKKSGGVYGPQEILKQPALFKALQLFQKQQRKGFYSGPVAKDVVDSINKAGGHATLADMNAFDVKWYEPLITQFHGYKVYLMPPPSSGGVLVAEGLELLDRVNIDKTSEGSGEEYHLMSEILSRMFRGRTLLGDPEFVKNPLDMLLSKEYLKTLATSISPKKSSQLPAFDESKPLPKESTETTNFSLLDHDGNGVAMTITLNGGYGSGVVTDNFGIALNNEIDDFTTDIDKPNMFGLIQGRNNLVSGGKRPLSSMTPTLVEKNGKIVMSIGAPGGPRIISGVFQALYRVLVRNLDMDRAIQAGRVHHQFLPNKTFYEAHRFAPEVLQVLKDRGHELEETRGVALVYGVRLNEEGLLEGAFDSRGEGAAGGF